MVDRVPEPEHTVEPKWLRKVYLTGRQNEYSSRIIGTHLSILTVDTIS